MEISGEKKINLSSKEWDAVSFIPKTRISFYGFGVFANRSGKDLLLKCQFVVGEEKSGEFVIQLYDKDKDPEKKWFSIDIREHGFQPVSADEGQAIHCMIKTGAEGIQ